MLKRTLTVVVAVATILTPLSAQAWGTRHDHEKQVRQCRFQWMRSNVWSQGEENATARCVVNRWPIPGGLSKLRAVGQCESGWGRFAYNPGGPYVGLFQHDKGSWDERVKKYTPNLWKLGRSWTNSRTQIVVTVRMVRDAGWGQWSCA